MFEWISDPTIWVGLATLIALEVVLGIDNLIFISVLAGKLPASQRDKARYMGLGLALCMRILLLCMMSWIVALTSPLFSILGHGVSGKDLILIVGGFFLLFKGTMELHERLEPVHEAKTGGVRQAILWQVLIQIVVLDAVFSLDSIITAVGMMGRNLPVMIAAVIIAITIMMAASKPLMIFVNRHPTVVVLCLGFLMMIAFSLIVEGLGIEVPKGYLYAAIGFSIVVEAFNQLIRHGQAKFLKSGDLRDRTADAVLALIGGRKSDVALGEGADYISNQTSEAGVFSEKEKDMVEGVLMLADRPAKSIMTHRMDIDYLDLDEDEDEIRTRIIGTTFSRIPVTRGPLDKFIGYAETVDLMRLIAIGEKLDVESVVKPALVTHESTSILRLIDLLRQKSQQVAFLLDEYGAFEGIVTSTDILESIAGDFPDADEEQPRLEAIGNDTWLISGWADIRMVSKALAIDLVDETNRYETLSGYVLHTLGHHPEIGAKHATSENLEVEVMELDRRAIALVRIRILNTSEVEH